MSAVPEVTRPEPPTELPAVIREVLLKDEVVMIASGGLIRTVGGIDLKSLGKVDRSQVGAGIITYLNEHFTVVDSQQVGEVWTHTFRSKVPYVRKVEPRFVMYHATPVKNLELVKQSGIRRSIPELPRTRLSPTEPTVYFADDVGNVIDYAEQSWEYHRMADPKWAIFKIEYDEFPTEPHADLEWGLPGVYWVDIDIPPEHVELYGIFDVEQHKWISVPAVEEGDLECMICHQKFDHLILGTCDTCYKKWTGGR